MSLKKLKDLETRFEKLKKPDSNKTAVIDFERFYVDLRVFLYEIGNNAFLDILNTKPIPVPGNKLPKDYIELIDFVLDRVKAYIID